MQGMSVCPVIVELIRYYVLLHGGEQLRLVGPIQDALW